MNIAIISLGCPKNQVDADVFCHALIKAGHQTVADPEQADIIIVNTCGFIQSAKEEAIENILMACQYKQQNPNLKVIGVLRVMYSPRISLQNLVSNELIQTFGAVVFDTVIPRNVSLAEAPSFGKPVMYYKKTSTGAKAYFDFGRELIRRVKDEVQAAQKE